MDLVLQWIEKNGGVDGMKARNTEKAQLLYDYIDNGKYYKAPVEKNSRSIMNIPFLTAETDVEKAAALNKRFVAEAEKEGLWRRWLRALREPCRFFLKIYTN